MSLIIELHPILRPSYFCRSAGRVFSRGRGVGLLRLSSLNGRIIAFELHNIERPAINSLIARIL